MHKRQARWWFCFMVILVAGGLSCRSGEAPPAPGSKRDAAGLAAADGAVARDLAPPPPDARGDLLAGEVAAGADATVACQGPIAACAAGAGGGACDLVCQSGCGCRQRCALASGRPACVPPAEKPVALGGTCSRELDNCQAGAVCLSEAIPACGSHCYRYCRSDAECPADSTCSVEVQAGSVSVGRVCSPAPEPCDPVGEGRCAGGARPHPTFGCYVLSSGALDRAICDCAGTRRLGEDCSFEHECAPGLECIKIAGKASRCRTLCRLGTPAACPGGADCLPLGTVSAPSAVFGYCAS